MLSIISYDMFFPNIFLLTYNRQMSIRFIKFLQKKMSNSLCLVTQLALVYFVTSYSILTALGLRTNKHCRLFLSLVSQLNAWLGITLTEGTAVRFLRGCCIHILGILSLMLSLTLFLPSKSNGMQHFFPYKKLNIYLVMYM